VLSQLSADVQPEWRGMPLRPSHFVPAAAVPAQVLSGSPVEINLSLGAGFKVMDVNEWAARWKTSAEFPQCLACGSSNTKEHAFTQVTSAVP
jgi:hypothetical protein